MTILKELNKQENSSWAHMKWSINNIKSKKKSIKAAQIQKQNVNKRLTILSTNQNAQNLRETQSAKTTFTQSKKVSKINRLCLQTIMLKMMTYWLMSVFMIL